MNSARALSCAGVLLALATICGAFGAHALRPRLAPDQLVIWATAVSFHFFNALGLLGVGLAMRGRDERLLRLVAALLLAGTVMFSGSLYGLALGGPRTLGVLTPLGGLAWISAWLIFAWTVRR